MLLAAAPAAALLGRLGDPGGQRRPRDGAGQLRQAGGLGGLRAEQAAGEGPVEGVNGGQGLVQSGRRFGEQVGAHHATALVGGNHCISGSGAVVGASSR